MTNAFIPCCYFPTSTLFVDDDEQYLKYLTLKFAKTLPCKIYNDPITALDFLTHYVATPFTEFCLELPESEHSGYRNIDVNISNIHKVIYNPKRFDEISTVVVDYAMPELNGLLLCEKIKEQNIKKVLLTGEADTALAVNAFNKGIINKFIRKDDPHFMEILVETIRDFQYLHFKSLSNIIIESLTKNPEYPTSCLNDFAFIQFFETLCMKNKICEFYLIEEIGSFLLVNTNGALTWLIVKDSDAIESIIFDVEHSDYSIPENILDMLRKKTHFLYFGNNDDLWKKPDCWNSYLFPCSKLEGKDTYYYTLLPTP